jgi:hypothetical protein
MLIIVFSAGAITFTDLSFAVFILGSIALFLLLPTNKRWIALLIVSCLFYLISGLSYVPFMLTSVLVSFLFAIVISKVENGVEDTFSLDTDVTVGND